MFNPLFSLFLRKFKIMKNVKKGLSQVLAEIKAKAKSEKELMIKKARNVEFVETASGVTLCQDAWDLQHMTTFRIKECELKAIREVVGQFHDNVSKCLAYDFDTTNELLISVQPKTGPFKEMIFEYRRQLLDSDDCKVETVQHEGRSAWSSKQLLCPVK